jgi:hypothetical protein
MSTEYSLSPGARGNAHLALPRVFLHSILLAHGTPSPGHPVGPFNPFHGDEASGGRVRLETGDERGAPELYSRSSGYVRSCGGSNVPRMEAFGRSVAFGAAWIAPSCFPPTTRMMLNASSSGSTTPRLRHSGRESR